MNAAIKSKPEILNFDGLVQAIRTFFIQLPDYRAGINTKYSIEDAALSAFSVFFMQSSSFLEYQKQMVASQERSNCSNLIRCPQYTL